MSGVRLAPFGRVEQGAARLHTVAPFDLHDVSAADILASAATVTRFLDEVSPCLTEDGVRCGCLHLAECTDPGGGEKPCRIWRLADAEY